MNNQTEKNNSQAQEQMLQVEPVRIADAELDQVVGGMRPDKTGTVTSAGVTKCCWGV